MKILLESDEELLLIDAVVMELIYTLIRVYGQSKDQILEITILAGARVGFTSWHEVVSLDPIASENIRLLRRERR